MVKQVHDRIIVTVFISYQYFMPAYKAGGPVQSLDNLVKNLSNKDLGLYIYCSNKDIDGRLLTEVEHDKWVNYTTNTKVFYNSGNKFTVYEVLADIKPDIIFVNGLFSYNYTIKPLLWSEDVRKIVSARGMLHPGALSQKTVKKKLFLQLFKWLGLIKKCEFHATTIEEEGFIRAVFGSKVKVSIAPNFPKIISLPKALNKTPGLLKLVTIALISPMKNIKLVLEALQQCKSNIEYNIYGPVKDEAYWNDCKALMQHMPSNVEVIYNGPINPDEVENTLTKHHVFIMPSKSENFGHAIFEALSSGKPVITSHFTPWNDLESNRAGYNVNVDHVSELTDAIEKLASFEMEQYTEWSKTTTLYAEKSINIASIKEAHLTMFRGA